MSKSNNQSSDNGVGFVGLLQLVFIVLKLCKVIDWSWTAVFLPVIILAVLYAILVVIAVMISDD